MQTDVIKVDESLNCTFFDKWWKSKDFLVVGRAKIFSLDPTFWRLNLCLLQNTSRMFLKLYMMLPHICMNILVMNVQYFEQEKQVFHALSLGLPLNKNRRKCWKYWILPIFHGSFIKNWSQMFCNELLPLVIIQSVMLELV